MIRLTQNDWRIFRRLQRKHKVSTEFLRYNLENIEKFIWFETWPRIVIRRYAIRKENRVFIVYYRLRRVLFDQSNSKIFKRMRQNIKQWSKRIVAWQKNHFGIKEYVEEVVYEAKSKEMEASSAEVPASSNEDVSRQLKEQLELLKSGRRPKPLITKQKDINLSIEEELHLAGEDACSATEEKQKADRNNVEDATRSINKNIKVRGKTASADVLKSTESGDPLETPRDWQINLESTPEKQITTQENIQPVKQLDTDEKTEKSHTDPSTQQTEKRKAGLNFLDMLMCKVSGSSANNITTSPAKTKDNLNRKSSSSSLKENYQHHQEHSLDSTDEFLGFDDCERIPGMLMTPIVPHSTKTGKNSVFVSESLNEYMRINDLETNYSIDEDKSVTRGKIFARNMEGLMTPKTSPPDFDMPAVPENLLKYRTVAERKHYLQKCSKNYRLAIINNEASIYRELQRRLRTQKIKSAGQMLAQSANSTMSFTRNGWNAASFINTEFNKYYYQVLDVDHGTHRVCLRGARGNNDEFHKTPYVSKVKRLRQECFEDCTDDKVWQYLKPIKTIAEEIKKLNRGSLPSVFKPCPLSHKTFQKPLDDDTAALLLAGGSMAVVRMPTVELEVFPEYGKPLHEIAKRYLQYILPHHDISREWAEFSVSTLQHPKTIKEAEQAAAKSFNSLDIRKSYTFVIPYLNDRSHILVRRVVDRSEKLDESFEQCVEEKELLPKTDFTFRKNLDFADDVLQTCADVVSDMINTVAISCSENSFIKSDPDGLDNDASKHIKLVNSKQDGLELPVSSPNNAVFCGGNSKKPKKQSSLLLELKRLNATIIDAAAKPENDKTPCSRDYCQMGCICVSLKEVAPMRQHCGKIKCMLECTCKPSNQSRIMRLETDGRTLTTEDAFMLRRKATARLARMEKEFTSTVVLTENETLLINETNNDKKRRCTKAPKRYEDFTDTEDEQRRNSPKKTAMTTIDKENHLAIDIQEMHDPVYVQDSILNQLKHCTVNLVPLPEMDNIAPWCMIHNLYKCFCKGRAVEGKPMVIEKEETNTTVKHDTEQNIDYDYSGSGKAKKYTFDKVEKCKNVASNGNVEDDEESNNNNTVEDIDEDVQNEKDADDDWAKQRKRKRKENREIIFENKVDESKTDDDSEETMEIDSTTDFSVYPQHTENQKPRRNLHDVRKRFYAPREETCRRQIPTPRRMFLYCNRRRRLNILKYIKENENDRTRLLLNEHVMRSVYYHKIDTANQKECNGTTVSSDNVYNAEKSKIQVPQPLKLENQLTTDMPKHKFLLVNEIVDLLEDDEDTNISTASNANKGNNSSPPSSSAQSCSSFEKLVPDKESADSTNHFQICSSGGVITVKKYPTSTEHQDKKLSDKPTSPAPSAVVQKQLVEEKESQTATDTGADELKLPKIASCFSLNVKANVPKSSPNIALNEDQSLDFTSVTSVNSAAFSQNDNQQAKNPPSPLSTASSESRQPSSSNALDMSNECVKDVYNSVIKTMNSLVSKKMQDIDCALQRESHIIPTPNADILCIMKWCNFLDAFCEGFAYIWQVKLKDSTFFVVTIQNIMPLIIGAMGIVNITALKVDKMPLMGRMLLHRFRNNETENLAVVMQGKQSYWVLKGFLKSDPTTACNKPTPESHPSLTKKINILCSLLVKQRQKDQKRKEKLANQWPSAQNNSATKTTTSSSQLSTQPPPQTPPTSSAPKVAQILPTRRIVKIQPRTVLKNQSPAAVIHLQPQTTQPSTQKPTQENGTDTTQKIVKQNELDSGKTNSNCRKRKVDNEHSTSLMKVDRYIKMSSNIEFRSVTQTDIDEIFLPEMHKLDHKWLVLDLHNDFSHIFVPEFRDLVSLDRIQKVINFALQKSKIVKLQFFQNAPFDAFVTPKSTRKIYFGPLTMNMKGPTLILLQSVDGQMMLRELYQLQHNIVKKPDEKTKAFWLVHLKGQTHFEMDVKVMNEKPTVQKCFTNASLTTLDRATTKMTTPDSLAKILNEKVKNIEKKREDDEDCVIIDDGPGNSCSKEVSTKILPQSNLLTTARMPIQSSIVSKVNNVDSQIPSTTTSSLLTVPKTTTIIKPVNPSNPSASVVINVPTMPPTSKPLSILTLPPNTIITGINSPVPVTSATPLTNVMPTQILNIPKTAVITGIESAPPEAPYSSTIFLTSSPSSSVTSVVATTTSAFTGNATTISNAVNNNRIQSNEVGSACMKQNMKTIRQALEAGPIKRRRISLFCSNKYDKISENLAVDAVIRKILPENAEDIQIGPVNEQNTVPSIPPPELLATVGSTQISKIASRMESTDSPTCLESSTNREAASTKSNAPIVFDVNFMDDGDEPTASIVIKPNSSTSTSSTTTATTSTSSAFISRTKATNSLQLKAPLTATSVCVSTVSNTSSSAAPPNKKMKFPILFNASTAVTSNSNETATVQGKIINSLVYNKAANILTKFSLPKSIAPNLNTATTNVSSPSTDQSPTEIPFPFSRTSVSLKVQKIVSSTVAGTLKTVKPITTTATITATQPVTQQTLTVKQVQDMLNKSCIKVAAINSTNSPPVASTSPLQILPAIKATIAPAKVTTVSATPTTMTPTISTTLPSRCVVSTPATIVKSIPPPVSEATPLNSTLTISKVQSFGAPQKTQNSDKTLTTPSAQILVGDLNEKVLTPTPPPHIQYGYIISAAHANQKFVAKRVAEEFYVKVPSVGILKLLGLAAVNNYLNKYIIKTLKETTPVVWQFVAASKAVQVQNHQKSLLVRKTKNTNDISGSSKMANIYPNNSLDEPILIDD